MIINDNPQHLIMIINGETISILMVINPSHNITDPAFQLTWLCEEKTCQGFPKINGEIWKNGILMGYSWDTQGDTQGQLYRMIINRIIKDDQNDEQDQNDQHVC